MRRRLLTSGNASASATDKQTAQRSLSADQGLRKSAAHDHGDCIVDRIICLFAPEQLDSPNRAPALAGMTQAVAEIPEPPPKLAALQATSLRAS